MAETRPNEPQQAELLDSYWAALARDPSTAAPAALDPEIAAVARRLDRALKPPEPEPAFATALRRRLREQPARRGGLFRGAGAPTPGGAGGERPWWQGWPQWRLALGAAFALALVLGVIQFSRTPQGVPTALAPMNAP